MRIFKNIPELTLLTVLIVIGYIAAGIFSKVEGTEFLSPSSIWLIVVGSFLMSTVI